jgi:hypothetical protein
MKVKLKCDTLGIPRGTTEVGYGYTDEPDCHMFTFESDHGKEVDVPYESFTWSERQTEFTISETYARANPELFEIIENEE